MAPKQVLVLNQYAVPRSIGAGTRHVELFERLPDWNALIVASRTVHSVNTSVDDHEGFKFLRLPTYDGNGVRRTGGFLIYGLKSIAVSFTIRPIDAVYASSPHLFAPLAGWIISRLRRAPFILEVRDLWPESIVSAGLLNRDSLLYRLLAQLERFVARKADRIVVVTPGWASHFAALGVTEDVVVVVPNGAELSDFEVTASKAALRSRYAISGFTAVFAGTHGSKDGINHILDAAAVVPNINFLLIGAGTVKKAAIQEASKRNLENVEFRDPVPKEVLPEILAACDVGIHSVTPMPVFQLGMSPNKLFDYLAAGIPIVSNAQHALRHITKDGECGRLGSEDQLGNCLLDVLTASQAQRQAWVAAGQDLIRSKFSREASARKLNSLLNSSSRPLGAHR